MGIFSKARKVTDELAETEPAAIDDATDSDVLALDMLANCLRCYGRHGFDIESMDAAELEQHCDAWARHITTGSPAPSPDDASDPEDPDYEQPAPVSLEQRQWADLQLFFRNHRRDEQSTVTERAEGMRSLVSEMTNGLRNAIVDDNQKDALVTRELAALGDAVDNHSIEQIRKQLARTVDVVSQVVHERQARYEAQLKLMSERVHTLRSDLVAMREKMNLDPLTQLHNRGAFDDVLAKQIDFSFLSGQPMALLMIDLDHFKAINDTHGHPGGDEVLQATARTLIRQFPRRSDFIARYGGEEFVLILVDVEPADLEKLGTRILEGMRKLEINYLDKSINVTCSVGIAACEITDSAESLLRRADAALYQAKENGRDCLVVAATD